MDMVTLRIRRFDPDDDRGSYLQQFRVPREEGGTVLQALIHVAEELDPSLAFRYGCRFDRCGLCALKVNGRPRLACRTKLKDGMVLGPLDGVPLARDLTVDREWLFATLRRLELYVEAEDVRWPCFPP